MSKNGTQQTQDAPKRHVAKSREQLDTEHQDLNKKKNDAIQALNKAEESYTRNPSGENQKALDKAKAEWVEHQTAFAEVDDAVRADNAAGEKARAGLTS